jgi:FAD/FMN-containing dehydrogenase
VILDREVGVDSVRSNRYLKDNTDVKYVMSVFCFGHAGDQNLHLNVILRLQDNITETEQIRIKKLVKDDLEQAVLTETMKWNGSISAEHGVGQQKSHLLHLARSASEVQVMKLMKKSLDPKCILNPGKVISLEHNMQEGQPLSCDSVLK